MDSSNILLIIGIVLILIGCFILFINRMKNKQIKSKIYDLSIDIELLMKSLKGKENIQDVSATTSKVRFELKDTSVDIETLKSLGASGIVESNQSITLIFGKQSQAICDAIKGELK